ncbi:MAG: hypothetical protein V8S81_05425 [Oscillospiraceae bacterium]
MKYEVCLSNDSCIFDSEIGFDTIAEAIEWGLGRGPRYVLHVGAQDGYTVSLGVAGNKVVANVGSPWECTFSTKSIDKIVDHVLCEIVAHIGDYGLGPDWDEVTIAEAVQAFRITRKDDGKLRYTMWDGQEDATRDYIKAHRAEIIQYLDAQSSANK